MGGIVTFDKKVLISKDLKNFDLYLYSAYAAHFVYCTLRQSDHFRTFRTKSHTVTARKVKLSHITDLTKV